MSRLVLLLTFSASIKPPLGLNVSQTQFFIKKESLSTLFVHFVTNLFSTPRRPFHMATLDFILAIPVSKNGDDCAVPITCKFSRMGTILPGKITWNAENNGQWKRHTLCSGTHRTDEASAKVQEGRNCIPSRFAPIFGSASTFGSLSAFGIAVPFGTNIPSENTTQFREMNTWS